MLFAIVAGMEKKLFCIKFLVSIIVFMGVCLWAGQNSFAWEGMSEIEELLVQAINQGREDAGVDCGFQIDPLSLDERLFDSAADHAAELCSSMTLSRLSEDGAGVAERMRDQGYYARAFGEGLGLLLFQRYVSPENAVSALYNAMIQDDDGLGESGIFNPELKDMGVSVQTGVTSISGRMFNYYLAVADLGLDTVASLDKYMVVGINAARQELDLPPFTNDQKLYEKAAQILSSSIAQYKGEKDAPALESEPDNIKSNTRIWVTTDIKTDSWVVQVLLDKLFRSELRLGEEMQVASGKALDHAGAAVAVAMPWEIDADTTWYINAVTLVAENVGNQGEEESLPELSGILYLDMDNSGCYSPGEELSSTPVYAYSQDLTKVFYSGKMGEFIVNLPSGQYLLESLDGRKVVNVEMSNKTIFFQASDPEGDKQ